MYDAHTLTHTHTHACTGTHIRVHILGHTLIFEVGLSMTYLICPCIFSDQLASHVTYNGGGGREWPIGDN